MIDWDNLTQDEYRALCSKRQKIEVDINNLIRAFEKDSELEVDDIRRYYLGEKAYFQLSVPQRILFFTEDGSQIRSDYYVNENTVGNSE